MRWFPAREPFCAFFERVLYCGRSGTIACSIMSLDHSRKWSTRRGCELIDTRSERQVQLYESPVVCCEHVNVVVIHDDEESAEARFTRPPLLLGWCHRLSPLSRATNEKRMRGLVGPTPRCVRNCCPLMLPCASRRIPEGRRCMTRGVGPSRGRSPPLWREGSSLARRRSAKGDARA